MHKLQYIVKNNNFETIQILKSLNNAHRYLGELKGKCQVIPNQSILLNTLVLQEAQDSSCVENIITTQDELFKYRLTPNDKNLAVKEVSRYYEALYFLFNQYTTNNLITINTITKAQQIITTNTAGIRKQIGTTLLNEQTNQIVYNPPPPNELQGLLTDLEGFINGGIATKLDAIIKMAIIHHQFESIHPFYDGNGRIGRIINIIYLVKEGLLDIPILYLSRYINHNKNDYYRLLQQVRATSNWEEWILFMIKGVEKTAINTIEVIDKINNLVQEYKHQIRDNRNKIYSQDLINNIFKHPYTKIKFLQQDLGVSRLTASSYLSQLTCDNLLTKRKLGRENYYINSKLVDILTKTKNLKNSQ